MLILSCDKFSDLWDGHVKLLERNWPDRNMETFIVTDLPTDKHYRNVRIISAGKEIEWSDRLKLALDIVKTEYVFITLDDYYLIKKVSDSAIDDVLKLMKKKQIDYVRLFPRPKSATKEELAGCQGFFRVDTSVNYSVNLYSGIWKLDFIKSTVTEPMNAWRFEVSLPKKAQLYKAKCCVSSHDEFIILDVVRKGKLLHKSYYYFKKHPAIYNGSREVNTWRYEIGLWFKTMVSRHAPKKIKELVKGTLRKKGHTFYSDNA